MFNRIFMIYLFFQYLSAVHFYILTKRNTYELEQMADGTSSLGSVEQGSTVGYGREEEEVSSEQPTFSDEEPEPKTSCCFRGPKNRKDKRKTQ